MRYLIDLAYPEHNFSLTRLLVASSIALAASAAALRLTHSVWNRISDGNLGRGLSRELFSQLLKLQITTLEQTSTGELVSLFQMLKTTVNGLVTFLCNLCSNILFLFVVPVLLIDMSPVMGLITSIMVLPICYLAYKQSSCSFVFTQTQTEMASRLSGLQTDCLSNIRSVKGLQQELFLVGIHDQYTQDVWQIHRKKLRINLRYGVILTFLRLAGFCTCIWLGWNNVLNEQLSLGQFMAFLALLNFLYTPMQDIVGSLATLEESLSGCKKVSKYLELPQEGALWLTAPCHINSQLKGEIAFDKVGFEYTPGAPVFTDVDFALPEQGFCAIQGPSGSGKTTILRLLVGFNLPTDGRITLGQRDIRSIPLEKLRAHMAVVWQDSGIYTGTLWDNLAAGKTLSQNLVDRVVEICDLEHYVAKLPHGYKTIVGSSGRLLSAGERQRLLMAKALLRDTPVILFDEVTANVDIASHERVIQRMRQEYRDKLIVCVTHQPTVAKAADRIIICDQGYVRENHLISV
jgi:ABC-type bacteriocin/lantibiotic exporter with double-glycine peptidase domain